MLNNFGLLLPKPNLFLRCAQPDADGFNSLRGLGVDFAFKLNKPEEFSPSVEAHFLGGGAQVQQVDQFSFTPSIDFTKGIINTLDDIVKSGIGVVVHCTHGRDRTGFLIAGWRILKQGWEPTAAIKEMEQYGASGIFKLADSPFIDILHKLGKP